ncbi:hypothetical protein ACF0H5_017315 [Mactra antiquata]
MAAPTNTGKDGEVTKDLYDIHVPSREIFEFYVAHILDCRLYNDEYKSCKKRWSRLDQKYLYGQELDCEHMKVAYEQCMKSKDGDQQATEYVVAYEKAKSDFRVENAQMNDAWEYRVRPPILTVEEQQAVNATTRDEDDLNRIVPKYLESKEWCDLKKYKESDKSSENQSTEINQNDNTTTNNKSYCVIS